MRSPKPRNLPDVFHSVEFSGLQVRFKSCVMFTLDQIAALWLAVYPDLSSRERASVISRELRPIERQLGIVRSFYPIIPYPPLVADAPVAVIDLFRPELNDFEAIASALHRRLPNMVPLKRVKVYTGCIAPSRVEFERTFGISATAKVPRDEIAALVNGSCVTSLINLAEVFVRMRKAGRLLAEPPDDDGDVPDFRSVVDGYRNISNFRPYAERRGDRGTRTLMFSGVGLDANTLRKIYEVECCANEFDPDNSYGPMYRGTYAKTEFIELW